VISQPILIPITAYHNQLQHTLPTLMSSHGLPKSMSLKPTPFAPSATPSVTREQAKTLLKQANIESFLKEYNALSTPDARKTKLTKLINQNNQLIDIHIGDIEALANSCRMIKHLQQQFSTHRKTIAILRTTLTNKISDNDKISADLIKSNMMYKQAIKITHTSSRNLIALCALFLLILYALIASKIDS